MTRSRWSIALAYALATLLAQAAHDHGASARDVPQALEGCDDPGAHWANHTDCPDLSHPEDYCLACQQRAEVGTSLDVATGPQVLEPSDRLPPTAPISGRVSVRSLSSRGPPSRA